MSALSGPIKPEPALPSSLLEDVQIQQTEPQQTWSGRVWKDLTTAVCSAIAWLIEKIVLLFKKFVFLMEKVAEFFHPKPQIPTPSLVPENDIKPISKPEIFEVVTELEQSLLEYRVKDLDALVKKFATDMAAPNKSLNERFKSFEDLTVFQQEVKGCADLSVDFLLSFKNPENDLNERLERLRSAFVSLKNHKFHRYLYDAAKEILTLIQDLNNEISKGTVQNLSEQDLLGIVSTLRMLN